MSEFFASGQGGQGGQRRLRVLTEQAFQGESTLTGTQPEAVFARDRAERRPSQDDAGPDGRQQALQEGLATL